MRTTINRILLPLMLFVTFGTVWAQQESPIVLSGDRTIIYIDRLALQGDETLMDVLMMYPELLVSGFDNMLDGYQLRMENVPISCNIRHFLTSTPANACTKIQVCENPGVAKGKTGLDGVIDLNMRHNTEGAHGIVNLEASTATNVSPMLKINYGRNDSAGYSTDIYANTSLSVSYPRHVLDLNQYADVHMNQHLGSNDKLLIYLRQSYESTSSMPNKQNYLARARYFHTFNQIGTELLLLAGYQHNAEKSLRPTDDANGLYHTKTGSQIYMVELNTPLPFIHGLQLMAGWEMDIVNYRYHLTQNSITSMSFETTDYYSVMNNDIYLQMDYSIGPVKLSLGDRLSFYRYGKKTFADIASRSTVRNFIMASVAATLAKGHQLQAGYYRRFINPDYLSALSTSERKVDVVRLAYTFTHKKVSTNLGTKYVRMVDENSHTIQVNVAASWMADWLILSGGANISHSISMSNTATYGNIRLAPKFRLPQQWRIETQFIWYLSNAPERILTGTPVYGLLAIEKSIENILNLSILWHDPFNSNLSSVVFAAKIMF